MCATSLDSREREIAIEAWLLAKRSHDALTSAWTASKEKVRLAKNAAEANEYWAKFEGVRAQYALIDKVAQQKEQLARKWRPAEVINIDDDKGDSARGDGARDKATEEASTEAVEIRNMNPQKPLRTSDDISAGCKTSTSAIPQLSLDELLRSTVSIRGHRKKQGTKRRAEEIEDNPLSVKKTSSKQVCSAATNKQATAQTSHEPEKPASPRKVFMRIPDQKKRQKSLD
ncbi:hypothetical protein CGCS363_v010101 [Colletotrichum siamense]|uniref:uncharacterized protein n=1 Tax=Colletotrichum siamense TaxID=690259 RepID=UPI001872A413|nr:uncharacterized protein CGCS363_v010101 [Colletotrichum siamense]KAF5494435.1 hypothetical protein CGCS363_v010101 [Colletotrichum siamense]